MDDIVRWVLIDQAFAPDGGAARWLARTLHASERDGRVHGACFTLDVVPHMAAIAGGLDRAALAAWGTLLQVTPRPGIDEWSYWTAVQQLRQTLHDSGMRTEVATRDHIGFADLPPNQRRHRAYAQRVDLRYDLPASATAPASDRPLPFVIGLIGDFAGPDYHVPLANRRFERVDDLRDLGRMAATLGAPRYDFGTSWLHVPVAKQELKADFARASRLEDSWLFRQLCVAEFWRPITLLVVDFAFSEEDTSLLAMIAGVAASAPAPVIIAAPDAVSGVPAVAALRRVAGAAAARYVAWARPSAVPEANTAQVSPAIAVAQRLAVLHRDIGWPTRLDAEPAGRAVEPAGLGALLAASRIAAMALRVIAHPHTERMSCAELEGHLNRWLARYVMTEAEAQDVVRAARPLRAARVELHETPEGFAPTLTVDLAYQAHPQHASFRFAGLYGWKRVAAGPDPRGAPPLPPPRVNLSYEIPDSLCAPLPERELPFVISVIGDLLAGTPPGDLAGRRMAVFDSYMIDRVIAKLEAAAAAAQPDEGAAAARRAASHGRLRDLVSGVDPNLKVRFRYCPVSKNELRADLSRTRPLRHSWLLQELSLGLGWAGVSVLIVDLDFGRDDGPLLARLAQVASTAMSTVLLDATPGVAAAIAAATTEARETTGNAVDTMRFLVQASPPPAAAIDAAASPAIAAGRTLAGLYAQCGWLAAFDHLAGAGRVDPPGLGAFVSGTQIARTLQEMIRYFSADLGSRARLEAHLNDWLAGVVAGGRPGAERIAAVRPLRAAAVRVIETAEGFAGELSLELDAPAAPAYASLRITVPPYPPDYERR